MVMQMANHPTSEQLACQQTMTTYQMQLCREAAEIQILEVLNHFENVTGLSITSVDLRHAILLGKDGRTVVEVSLDVRL